MIIKDLSEKKNIKQSGERYREKKAAKNRNKYSLGGPYLKIHHWYLQCIDYNGKLTHLIQTVSLHINKPIHRQYVVCD